MTKSKRTRAISKKAVRPPNLNKPLEKWFDQTMGALFFDQSITNAAIDNDEPSAKIGQAEDELEIIRDFRSIFSNADNAIHFGFAGVSNPKTFEAKLFSLDIMNYALEKYEDNEIFNRDKEEKTPFNLEILKFANNFDSQSFFEKPHNSKKDSFTYSACEAIINCCQKGYLKETKSFVNALLQEFTQGIERAIENSVYIRENKINQDTPIEITNQIIEISWVKSRFFVSERGDESESSASSKDYSPEGDKKQEVKKVKFNLNDDGKPLVLNFDKEVPSTTFATKSSSRAFTEQESSMHK